MWFSAIVASWALVGSSFIPVSRGIVSSLLAAISVVRGSVPVSFFILIYFY